MKVILSVVDAAMAGKMQNKKLLFDDPVVAITPMFPGCAFGKTDRTGWLPSCLYGLVRRFSFTAGFA